MNLCHSTDVPQPEFDYPDERLAEILDSSSDVQIDDIRIPMSIGELHKDTDKGELLDFPALKLNLKIFDSCKFQCCSHQSNGFVFDFVFGFRRKRVFGL